MSLEPTESTELGGSVNPYFMQNSRVPSKELVMETQKFLRHNPGVFEDLHKHVKDINCHCFEGFKCIINRALNQHLQISHSFHVSNYTPSKYSFGGTFVGETEVRAHETTPVIMAEMDGESNLNFQTINNFGKRLKGRLVAQSAKSNWTAFQADCTYYGDSFSCNATVVNPDVKDMSGVFVTSYLQRFNKHFDAGVELVCQRAPGGVQQMFVTSFGAALRGDDNPFSKPSPTGMVTPSAKWTAAASVNQSGWNLSYHRYCGENLQAGVEYEHNSAMGGGEVSFKYQFELPKSGFVYKGSVNSSATVSGVAEYRSLSLPLAFFLSASHNYKKAQSAIGIGVNVG